MPQILDVVTWQSGTGFGDLSASRIKEPNLEQELSWFTVSPNNLRAANRNLDWSCPSDWPLEEPGTTDTLEQHRTEQTYDLEPVTTPLMRSNNIQTVEQEWRLTS